jgi:hypothetical protein
MEPIDLRECKLAAEDLTVHDALVLIGDYIVNSAGDEDRPGIVAALGCMLSIDDIDASDVWLEMIAERDREGELGRIADWVRSGAVYRVEYDKIPRGPYFGRVIYMEAASIADAASAPSDGYARIVSVREAAPDDIDEIYEIGKREGS